MLTKTNSVYTVWTSDFDMQVCKFHSLFISAESAKKKKENKALLPAGVSKFAAH
jgi:hypothetical protein